MEGVELSFELREGTPGVPHVYQGLVEFVGPAIGVEEARARWGDLVAAAESGTVTLIARDPGGRTWDWVALVPLSEVAEPLAQCPVWTLTDARRKLGGVIAAAAAFSGPVAGSPQILARHRTPVAAVIAAIALVDRPVAADRLTIETVLHAGGAVTLTHFPGVSGATDEDGNVIQEPEEAAYLATATAHDGAHLGSSEGPTVAEALLRLHHRNSSATPWPDSWYSNEPPF
jgi:hypothetical protein